MWRRTRQMIIVVFFAAAGGCAQNSDERGSHAAAMGQPAPTTQQNTAALMMQYRQEAADLREMANRRQIETNVLEKELGSDHERVRRKRDLAQDLLTAADEVEQKARNLRRDVPHGMMQ